MSLVAYGASDESEPEPSDSEDCQQVEVQVHQDQVKDLQIVADQISDDEEYQSVSSSTAATTNTTLFTDYPLLDALPNHISHQSLPSPQKIEEAKIEETELEDEVRQKPSELANAPKPPPKRTKQPVKITIPSLNDLSDEDDGDKSSKKKVSSSTTPSGLFSLLPPPIHSAKKEINRPLIPHSLAKKPSQPYSKSAVQAQSVSSSTHLDNKPNPKLSLSVSKPKPHLLAASYDDSDEEDNDVPSISTNFFSLSSNLNKDTDSVSSTKEIKDPDGAILLLPEKKTSGEKQTEKKTSENPINLAKDIESPSLPHQETVIQKPEPGLMNNSPLDFGSASRFSSCSSASSSSLGGWTPNNHQHKALTTASYQPSFSQSSVDYNMADVEDPSAMEMPTDDLEQVMNDKEFQRLQGKRKRGLEGAISFVDAKVDDYVDPSELFKNITEESSYTSKKQKDDMPTNQQKRKKQITYLAYQAKEKELELKNTWSQNKMTKRQTQAKYGF